MRAEGHLIYGPDSFPKFSLLLPGIVDLSDGFLAFCPAGMAFEVCYPCEVLMGLLLGL
jgi:hypothetical protein